MSVVAIIQARMGSTRFPGKVLKELGGRPLLEWIVAGASVIPGVERLVVATSTEKRDDDILQWCDKAGIDCFRGSERDVLNRFAKAAKLANELLVLRLTADCPLIDPIICGQVIALRQQTGADYASNIAPWTFPDGLDCEVFTAKALFIADRQATRSYDREHVTPFIRNNRHRFKVETLVCPIPGLGHHRWTIDAADDLTFAEEIVTKLGADPRDARPSHLDILRLFDRAPELAARSRRPPIPPSANKVSSDLHADSYTYAASAALLSRAEKTVPLGSQTFSKSAMQYPQGAAPHFLTHGLGGRVWDVDGREYVDLVMGLLPNLLGYQDPDVDTAVRRQLVQGTTFSLATELEYQLAELICAMVPSAEAVRFGKNGSDATSGAVRVARAYTGRDRIVACGYHGWQDWYIGATSRNRGVPKATRELTHVAPYNDIGALEATLESHPSEFAAVIMEPMNISEPKPGFLADVKELTHRHGALLIFDEVITGFRFSRGGAQELFDVLPDLTALGKGLGNGLPISAVAGRADVMQEMKEVFFSFTAGGEALSLAGAIAVLKKIGAAPVLEAIYDTGKKLADEVTTLIHATGLKNVIGLSGHPSWKILVFEDHPMARKEAIRTYFMKEMIARRVLVNTSHNISYAHNSEDIALVVSSYESVLPILSAELESGRLEEGLGIPAIQPLFKVR